MRILANENLHSEIVRGLRQANYDVLFVPEIGLAGHKDREILEYSEKNGLILISGDKDFGGLIEFGPLWGHGKVIILRYRFVNIRRMVNNMLEILSREAETLTKEESIVVVLSESGYRIHKPGEPAR